MGERLILWRGERNGVAVRILDHDRVDAVVADWLEVGAQIEPPEFPDHLIDVVHDQRARPVTGSVGRRLELQGAAAWKVPFNDFGHRLVARAEKLAVPRRCSGQISNGKAGERVRHGLVSCLPVLRFENTPRDRVSGARFTPGRADR